MATTLVSVALGAALLLNIVATILLVRADHLSRRQKAGAVRPDLGITTYWLDCGNRRAAFRF